MRAKTKNPLSYLGWLGIIGIIGINTGDFLLQLFLVYFLFFLYRNTPMDELFILDIRKAGLRSFLLSIILNSITIIYIVIVEKSVVKPENLTTIIRMFAGTYLIGFLVFALTLLYFQKCEKRSLND